MSTRKKFTDHAFTNSDLYNSRKVLVEYEMRDGTADIKLVTDAETGRVLTNSITAVSYRRLLEAANHLGTRHAVPDSSD